MVNVMKTGDKLLTFHDVSEKVGLSRVGAMTASSMCLSRLELAELSRTPQRKRQAAFLRKNGVRHYLDHQGWPVVLRSAVDPTTHVAKPVPEWSPSKAV